MHETAAVFRRLPGVILRNQYGPTEITVDCTEWVCSPEDGRRPMVPLISSGGWEGTNRWRRAAMTSAASVVASDAPISETLSESRVLSSSASEVTS